MISNSESKRTSKSNSEENIPKIWVEPSDHITFVCSKNQTVGIIKIYAQPLYKKTYEFQIKTTNKNCYKVSEPNGLLNRSPYTIYIYLRQISSLESTLSDKFKVSVIDKKRMKAIFSEKFGVVIQSNLSVHKEQTMNDSNSISRGISIYTSPSVLGDSNSITKKSAMSVLRMSHLDSQISMRKQKHLSSNVEQKKTLKQMLNESIQVLEKKKRKQALLERQIKNKKAKQRFRVYLIVLFMMATFLIGFYGRRSLSFGDEAAQEPATKYFIFF